MLNMIQTELFVSYGRMSRVNEVHGVRKGRHPFDIKGWERKTDHAYHFLPNILHNNSCVRRLSEDVEGVIEY
jgi:hypothetical protein